MTVRSIERLMVSLLWAICLVVIVRWFVLPRLDHAQRSEPLRLGGAQSANTLVRSVAASQ